MGYQTYVKRVLSAKYPYFVFFLVSLVPFWNFIYKKTINDKIASRLS